ncbi:MAG TPA: transcription-repair coupling factor [Thermomicrobiales bacterium]|nr:transcription-repair coupling factor [Thermomicrobiales bacterium]
MSASNVAVEDLPFAARPAVIAAISEVVERPVIVVSSRADRSIVLASAVSEFLADPSRVVHWPAPPALPYERLSRDTDQSADLVAALSQIAASPKSAIVFASPASITHAVMSAADLAQQTRRIQRGELVRQADLAAWAASVGYEPVTIVQRVGEFARRGGIIDIYSPGASGPARLDFFGDEIDSIRLFDPNSQRSLERLESLTLLPAMELPVWKLREAATAFRRLDLSPLRFEVREELERTLDRAADGIPPAAIDLFAPYLLDTPTTIIDHLPDDALVVMDDPGTVELAGAQRDEHARDHYLAAINSRELPGGMPDPFISFQHILTDLSRRQALTFGAVDEPARTSVVFTGWTVPTQFAGRIADIVATVSERSQAGWRIALATDQIERLTDILEDQDIYPRRSKGDARGPRLALASGDIEIVPSDLDGGFEVASAKLMLLTDLELYGFHKTIRAREPKRREAARAFAESLAPGDHVVHIDHGVAVFQGLIRMQQGGVEREYLLLEFAKGERLYVPVDQSHRVTVYSSGGLSPALSTLGSGEWVKTKRRVRRAVRDMAYELINLYAARDAAKGYQYGPDTIWDHELDTSFPYIETTDQARAIVDVKGDMLSDKPMDRLICGDVGFGKTEIAMRAAFKAVNAGKQVAILVPTTVLALQHFATFTQRLAAFPVRIEMLSRLRSDKEQREVVKGLADGSVDIVIGTHRLVQRDVRFKDLGLVVIDEEQRFGVRQKEFLKQLRTEVDVITMSATPIPRTLHIALAGIRDISVIETAPNARLPIRTFVTKTNDQLIRDVILREIERGGQVFFVHNRVHSIGKVVQHLHELVPEARIGVGHGQMDEEVLESVMMTFVQGEFDVLVCTTIIESGVDIPNANTIIIDNADTFGLTQLYQLRGRVGRGSHRAYAYLLIRPHKPLSPEAEARLEAIQEATELGSGMRVALRDMEIRGAGNLLGAEQSGHIAEVGYELYLRLLAQAVEEARRGAPMPEQEAVTMDLPITALIPASYIQDVELRLATYRAISGIEDERGLADIRSELEDRFGELPDEVEHLLALIQLRIRSERLGIASIVEREREMVIRPVETGNMNTRKLIGRFGHAIKITPSSIRLRLVELDEPWAAALDAILDEIELGEERRRENEAAVAVA